MTPGNRFLVLALGLVGAAILYFQQAPESVPQTWRGNVEVVSLKCVSVEGRPRARLTIRNGDESLSNPVATIAFGFIPRIGRFSPTELAPHAVAMAEVTGGQGETESCSLNSIRAGGDSVHFREAK